MDVQGMIVALGPGGTRELAERALEAANAMVAAGPDLEIGGLTEVATELGVTRQKLGHWISGRRGPGDFPAPIAELAATPVWIMEHIRNWRTAHPELFMEVDGYVTVGSGGDPLA